MSPHGTITWNGMTLPGLEGSTAVVTGTAGSVVGVIAGTAGAALLIRSGVIENLDAHLTISPVSLAGAVVR